MSDRGIEFPTPGADEDEDPRETVVFGVTSALIFAVGFGLLALGVSWFWIVFPIGFGGVLPAVVGLLKLYRDDESTDHSTAETDADALETLRERYARGEIDESEFERRVAGLLETESVDEATVDTPHEKHRER